MAYTYTQYDYGENRGVRYSIVPDAGSAAPGDSVVISGQLYLPGPLIGTTLRSIVLDLVKPGSETNPRDWDDYDALDGDVYERLEYPLSGNYSEPIDFSLTFTMTRAFVERAGLSPDGDPYRGQGERFYADLRFAFRTQDSDLGYFDTPDPVTQRLSMLSKRQDAALVDVAWSDATPFKERLGGMLQNQSSVSVSMKAYMEPKDTLAVPASLRVQIGPLTFEKRLNLTYEDGTGVSAVLDGSMVNTRSYALNFDFGALDLAGTQPVTITVTDARGYTGTLSATLAFIPYAPPALTSFLPERYVSVLTEDEPVYQASDEGVDVWLSYAGSVQALSGGNQNSWTLELAWWPEGDETSLQTRTLASGANGGAPQAREDRTLFTTQLAASVTWKLRLTLTDWVGFSVSRIYELEKAECLFAVEPYGVAVGMRSTATAADAGKLEVAEDWKVCGVLPVGSIHLSVDPTNPSAYFGGTWVSFGAGRVLVGVDADDADFNAAQLTGGEKTHTLTVSEMPSHTHNFCYKVNCANGSARWGVGSWGDKTASFAYTNENAGGSQPHNNLQPYVTCYMWLRTA